MTVQQIHDAHLAMTPLGSSVPAVSGQPAPDDRLATQGAGAILARILAPTTELERPSITFEPSLFSLFEKSHASQAGFHAVSGYLTCPEQSRLYSLGVRRIPWQQESSGPEDLDALNFGTACHHLRAVRVLYGDAWEQQLNAWQQELTADDFTKMKLIFRTYNAVYPRELDTFEVLGVEALVQTDLRTARGDAALVRSVRYDTIIRQGDGYLWSFEAKFLSRGGQNCVNPYMGQAMTQVAIWNANSALVQRYGRMLGVLFDVGLKTQVPNIERHDRVFGKVHHRLAVEYLRTPENVVFMKNLDGSYPRMLHACWGRWRPCEMISLCHEQSYGDYTIRSEPLQGLPL